MPAAVQPRCVDQSNAIFLFWPVPPEAVSILMRGLKSPRPPRLPPRPPPRPLPPAQRQQCAHASNCRQLQWRMKADVYKMGKQSWILETDARLAGCSARQLSQGRTTQLAWRTSHGRQLNSLASIWGTPDSACIAVMHQRYQGQGAWAHRSRHGRHGRLGPPLGQICHPLCCRRNPLCHPCHPHGHPGHRHPGLGLL